MRITAPRSPRGWRPGPCRTCPRHIRKTPNAGSPSGALAAAEREPQHRAGVRRVDDPVVPQPGRRVVRVALRLVLPAIRSRTPPPARDRRGCAPPTAPSPPAPRPSPRSARSARGTAAAASTRARTSSSSAPNDPPITTVSFGTRVVATAVTILAPFLAIPPASYSRPTMNPVMFCRNTSGTPRWSQLDEVRTLEGRLENRIRCWPRSHRMAVDPREPGDQRGPVQGELVEPRPVDDPGDHLAHVVGGIRGSVGTTPYSSVGSTAGSTVGATSHRRGARAPSVPTIDRTIPARGRRVRRWSVTRRPGSAGRRRRLLGRHDLAGGRLHQRRTAEEDRPGCGRSPPRRSSPARTPRRPCTSPARRRSAGCPARTSAPGCRRSARSARGPGTRRPASAGTPRRSRRVDARQPVLLRDLLRPQVLLHRQR